MKKIQFDMLINASAQQVWNVLWNKETYMKWTAPFCEGSYVETDNWKKGSKVLFLSPGGNGMVSEVLENIPGEYMAFLHKGEVKEFVEDTESEKVKQWAGATETYRLTPQGDKTNLHAEVDITEEFAEYMEKSWPLALQEVKRLSEEVGTPA